MRFRQSDLDYFGNHKPVPFSFPDFNGTPELDQKLLQSLKNTHKNPFLIFIDGSKFDEKYVRSLYDHKEKSSILTRMNS